MEKKDKISELKSQHKLVLGSQVPKPGKRGRGNTDNLRPKTLSPPQEVIPGTKETAPPIELPATIQKSQPGSRTLIKYEDGLYITVKDRLLELKKSGLRYQIKTHLDYHSANNFMICQCTLTIWKDGLPVEYDGISWAFMRNDGNNTRKMAGELQTWAWGRALGAAGYGIDTELASGDEVVQALIQSGEGMTISGAINEELKSVIGKKDGKKISESGKD